MGDKYVIVTATVHLFQVSLNMYIYMIAQMPDLNLKDVLIHLNIFLKTFCDNIQNIVIFIVILSSGSFVSL